MTKPAFTINLAPDTEDGLSNPIFIWVDGPPEAVSECSSDDGAGPAAHQRQVARARRHGAERLAGAAEEG